MRVMHLVQCGPTTGGTVSHVATQVTHQIARGLKVGVVAGSDGVLTEHCRGAGADVFVDPTLLPAPGESADPAVLFATGAAWRPDLIHAHLMHAGFRGAELSTAIGAPLLYTQHMYHPVDPFLQAALATGADFPVITVAEFAQRAIGKFLGDAGRVHHVPNGVDVPAASSFRLEPGSGPQVLYCGRLSPEKGADVAILAFELMLGQLPGAKLHLVGTGPDETLLRRLVSALGIAEHARFYGSVSGALTAEIGADVLLVPSRGDAASLVVLEAMASGIPIVAAAVGGIPELVRHEIDGLLVAPDDPPALAGAALSVLTGEERGAGMARRARDRHQRLYTAARMVEGTCAVYETLAR
ncbi:glycosyltransferase family 4 protein [Nonomuraea rhodomycinica]|uniref:Glycosyltransferase family 4 protein n=1 Tax=Nonomuraea rhodomycinica TaxID=1712872 RepID=A0A7Y6MFK7_9ACTN|nr:glycosyltransferase family 4 protein [Nonomuraea rhodomycinica]NUW46037.1 glycosyltransferase family 4 protein [Nonomuraea rhodomycinica]